MRKTFLFLAVALLFIAGCEKKPETKITVTREEAALITHKTDGVISADSEIIVRFLDELAKPEQVDVPLKEKVFSFSPSIDGETKWRDRQTLVFKPNAPMEMTKVYEGHLDLKKLFPSMKLPQDRIDLLFQIEGRVITTFDGKLELVDKNDPTRFRLKGEIKFNTNTSLDDLRKSMSMKINGSKLIFDISESGENAFALESEMFMRTDTRKEILAVIEKSRLELGKDFQRNWTLPPLRVFEVTEAIDRTSGDDAYVELLFSDDLDPAVDYRGFVTTDPKVEIEVKAAGRSLYLRGPFAFGGDYNISVKAGMRSLWGTKTSNDKILAVDFEDILPQIEFTSSGYILPSSNKKSLNFRSVNVEKVAITINKVFENNLCFFIQDNSISADKSRRDDFWNAHRVGIEMAAETLYIGTDKNKWLQSQLDLAKLFEKFDKGLYLIELSFGEEEILVSLPEDWHSWRKWDYFWSKGRIYKPLVQTDVALTAKSTGEGMFVFANDVISTKPISGVEVRLRSYQNQIIGRATTNSDGIARLDSSSGYFIEADFRGSRSILVFDESQMNTSLFDVGGATDAIDDVRAFIYTERGVYRPSDTINISVIARNQKNTFPDDLPATLKVYNPRNRLVIEKTQKKAIEGFYNFEISTDLNAPTGNWRAEVHIGEKVFSHRLKIEEVVPYRIKVNVESEADRLTSSDKTWPVNVSAKYLFGNPAKNLDCVLTFSIFSAPKSFAKYGGFVFDHEGMSFSSIESGDYSLKLDDNGETSYSWTLPTITSAPSALRANVDATVYEKGGRQVPNSAKVDIDPYTAYVGIRVPESRFSRVGENLPVHVLLIDPEGKPISGRSLKYRIYRNRGYWWYDYDSRDDFRKRFKTHYSTELIKEGVVTTDLKPAGFEFKPDNYGQLLIEVQDGETGHTAGVFMYARDWGRQPASKDADILLLKSDSEKYNPGDVAKVVAETPTKGRALLSIEKGNKVLKTQWVELKGNETVFDIQITEDMVPNAYAVVTVIQPHSQTTNDRPMRMFGLLPLMVEQSGTRLDIQIDAPDELAPHQKFEVGIQVADGEQVQYTVAVVDEGLLDLTNFKTPDPWAYYYRKEALMVYSYDLFDQIIGANWGDIYKKFSIGGGFWDGEMDLTSPVKTRRFKPVCMFSGPHLTSPKGKGTVEFTMPEYIGSVRIMVVASKANRYGSAEEAVPVKSPLMAMPTLPRVLGPGDEILVPVTVFAMRNGIGKTEVGIEVEGELEIISDKKVSLSFSKVDETEVYFRIRAKMATGESKIKVYASAGKERFETTTDIAVRPQGFWASATETKAIDSGGKISLSIPADGIPGTNSANITISRIEKLEINDRIAWLIRYPYGCIEQTVSAAFPQLYMREIIEMQDRTARKTDENINAAIDRLRVYQTYNGAFSYWPNGDKVNTWATTYAGHFMVEARAKGYHVPDDIYNNWLQYEKADVRTNIYDPNSSKLLARAYQVYVLAMANEPAMGAMNLLRQNYFNQMPVTSKWLLAAAYEMAGSKNVANTIVDGLGIEVAQYKEFSGTYGSSLRDEAIILEILTLRKDKESAYPLFRDIAEEISSDQWLSTQSSAYCLLAMGKFVKEFVSNEGPLKGEITLPKGTRVKFDTKKSNFTLPITENFGEDVSIELTGKGNAFVTMNWVGVPMVDTISSMSSNLSLSRTFLTEDGMNLPVSSVRQGETFWCLFSVKNLTEFTIEEVALSQVLPAGWEIENVRLMEEGYPAWTRNYKLGAEEYVDLRDDRANWFFDLRRGQQADFLLKLNAVTVGDFHLTAADVSAMYNDRFKARVAGRDVSVRER